jgi:hypothetical protein
MQFIQPAVGSLNPYERKAALIALALLAEGCADYLRNRYIIMVNHIKYSLSSASRRVCRLLEKQVHNHGKSYQI